MKSLILVLFIISTYCAVSAQVPGKINGIVTSENGEPLIGVNIEVEGLAMGASTDIDGAYVILNIIPGTYTLTASYIGFQKTNIQKVIVKPDLTTQINFTLKEKIIELDEAIVVTAEAPLIQRDATAKVMTITGEEIKAMPVENLQEILATQSNVSVLSNTPNAKAGYNIRGIDDIRLRGGRNNEVALMIDGVKVSNPVFGGFGTQISKSAIEQLSIESGGYSAKYGNALSGVINLTTKENRGGFGGSFRYYTSRPFGLDFLSTEKGSAQRKQNFQTTFNGKILDNLSFFVSTELNLSAGTTLLFDDILWDDNRTIKIDSDSDGNPDSTIVLPTSKDIINKYLQYGNLDSIQSGLASNWKKVKGPDGRTVNPIDQFSGWKGLGWNNFYNIFGKTSFRLTPTFNIRFSTLIDRRYRQINNFNAYYDYNMPGQNIQILSSDKQTLSINHSLSSNSYYDLRLSRFHESREIRILKDYDKKYADWYNVFEPKSSNVKSPSEYTPYSSTEAVRDPFESSFYLKADNRWYSGDNSVNYEFRFDYTNQYNKNHKIETGTQFNYLDLKYHSYQNITQEDPFPTTYQRFPKEGAIYLQHKSELDKLILNIGARLDYYDSGGDFWKDPFDPLAAQSGSTDTLEYNEFKKAESKINLSPRIGMAYPLTSNTVLFFNFGHFYQNPNYRDLYRASGDNREISLIRGNIIGNPNLQPEKAIQYELSLQHKFTDDIAVKINLWSKETTNQVGSVVVPAYSDPGRDNPFTYAVFVNNNFGSAKGLDVNIKKRMGHSFGFDINYTYSLAKVLQPTSWDGYWSGASDEELPKQETTAPWDQTHVLRGNFQYRFADKTGPNFFGTYWFQNMIFNLIYYGESGLPYTPTVPGGVISEPYSERWPSSHRFDIRINKQWDLWKIRLTAFLEIKNIFDRKNVLTGYTRTGSATNPGTASYYTRSSTYWDSRNNNNFALRRTIYFGLEFIFGGDKS